MIWILLIYSIKIIKTLFIEKRQFLQILNSFNLFTNHKKSVIFDHFITSQSINFKAFFVVGDGIQMMDEKVILVLACGFFAWIDTTMLFQSARGTLSKILVKICLYFDIKLYFFQLCWIIFKKSPSKSILKKHWIFK